MYIIRLRNGLGVSAPASLVRRISVESEDAGPDSTLSFYRRAISLRHEHSRRDLRWLDTGHAILGFVRSTGWSSITDFGTTAVELPP
jgi:alpha-glucosidase